MSGHPGRREYFPKAPLVDWRHELLDDPRPSKHAKYVWLALSVYWKPDGRDAWVAVSTLARQLDLARSTVQKALRELTRLDLVGVEVRPGFSYVYHATGVFERPPAAEAASHEDTGASGGGAGAFQGRPTLVSRRPEVVIEGDPEEVTQEAKGSENRVDEGGTSESSSLEEERLTSDAAVLFDNAVKLLRHQKFREWLSSQGRHEIQSRPPSGRRSVGRSGPRHMWLMKCASLSSRRRASNRDRRSRLGAERSCGCRSFWGRRLSQCRSASPPPAPQWETAVSGVPSPALRLDNPDAVLTRTDLRELGYERRAVDAVFRACPVEVWPGYSRPMIRVADFLEWRDRCTYRDGRVRPLK
jgi:hypothetical protein